jgi:hypothetical protein
MGNNFEQFGENIPMIQEIPPIEHSMGAMVATKEQLKELVEAPLLSTCEEFYDNNIRTISASANTKNLEDGHGYVEIDFDTLSDQNKAIGESVGSVVQKEDGGRLFIKIPITEASTFNEIKNNGESIAHQFHQQEMRWAPSYTLEQLEQAGLEEFKGQLYFDKETQRFYLSEEHAEKSKIIIAEIVE